MLFFKWFILFDSTHSLHNFRSIILIFWFHFKFDLELTITKTIFFNDIMYGNIPSVIQFRLNGRDQIYIQQVN